VAQEIRFCRTDGGRVAYAVVGEGPALVLAGWWVSHLEVDWERPDFRAFVEALGERYTVVRYDPLGTGLSDRDTPDPAMGVERELMTLAAVLDAARYRRAAVFGVSSGGVVGAAFAARQPERVDALILYGSYARGERIGTPAVREAVLTAVRSHWGVGSRLLADVFMPRASAEELAAFARFRRAAASAEVAAKQLEYVYSADVRDELGGIRAPTLVLHRRRDRAIPSEQGSELAAGIPGSRLMMLEGDDHLPWRGEAAAVLAAVEEFLEDRLLQ
jgi:pimeloyl-ACP methyl ester carboxylesterase